MYFIFIYLFFISIHIVSVFTVLYCIYCIVLYSIHCIVYKL